MRLRFGPKGVLNETQTLGVSEDWMLWDLPPTQKLLGRLFFVGFGITAAEQNYDDYNGMMKGAIALALPGTPDGDNPHGQFQRYEDIRWKRLQRGMRAQRHS